MASTITIRSHLILQGLFSLMIQNFLNSSLSAPIYLLICETNVGLFGSSSSVSSPNLNSAKAYKASSLLKFYFSFPASSVATFFTVATDGLSALPCLSSWFWINCYFSYLTTSMADASRLSPSVIRVLDWIKFYCVSLVWVITVLSAPSVSNVRPRIWEVLYYWLSIFFGRVAFLSLSITDFFEMIF